MVDAMRQAQAKDFDITPWGSGKWSVAPKDISIYSPSRKTLRSSSADLFDGTLNFGVSPFGRRITIVTYATLALLVLSGILICAILRHVG